MVYLFSPMGAASGAGRTCPSNLFGPTSLTVGECEGQWQAMAIADKMDFGGQVVLATAQRIIYWFVRAPFRHRRRRRWWRERPLSQSSRCLGLSGHPYVT